MITAEQMAELLHDTYERLAPAYGLPDDRLNACPWDQLPDTSRALMAEATASVLYWLLGRGVLEQGPVTYEDTHR